MRGVSERGRNLSRTSIHGLTTDGARRFLLSLHDADPAFAAIDLPQAADLPSVRWKLQNLKQQMDEKSEKLTEQRTILESLFDRI